MFYTVQELMAQIKGWEYIIAIVSLALFLAFWKLLSRGPRRLPAVGQRPRQAARGESTALAASKPQITMGAQGLPCWVTRECPPQVREGCAAYRLDPLPCWVARSVVDKQARGQCDTCPVYARWMERLVARARPDLAGPARTSPQPPGT